MIPALTPLITLQVSVGKPVSIDAAPPGRRFIPITGGTVDGAFAGRVLPGGGDWQNVSADGQLDISAHYILDIDGHGMVEIHSDGLRHAPPPILAALARGETVDPGLYYFRTAIRMRTAAPGLLRLNAILAVSTGERQANGVRLRVFELG